MSDVMTPVPSLNYKYCILYVQYSSSLSLRVPYDSSGRREKGHVDTARSPATRNTFLQLRVLYGYFVQYYYPYST